MKKENEHLKKLILAALLSAMALSGAPLFAADKTEPASAQAAQEAQRAEREKEEARDKEREARDAQRQERDRDREYQRGTRALDQRKWDEAIAAFEKAAEEGGSRTDGALYWKAYGQNKAGRRTDALATLADLKKRFPESRWTSDANALEVEIRQASGQPANPEDQSDEELKLIAVNSLMHTDSEKALPILEKLLASNQPPKVREQALFVLSQSNSPKAREIVGKMARGTGNPDVQMKSLEYLAMFGGQESRKVLEEVYGETKDKKVKRAILHYFMIGGDRERLLAAVKQESDPDLRREAIGQLGIMGAGDDLAKIYESETDKEARKKILEALFIAGKGEKLAELARNEKDPELRLKAVESLGLTGSKNSAEALQALYQNESDKKVRMKVIEAFFLQGNDKAIVQIAKTEKDPALRKKAIEQLAIMNSKEGSEFFMEILNK